MNAWVGSLSIAVCLTTLSAAPTWRAGVAREVITPAEDMWMAGYAGRKTASEGVLQDLQAKALALADDEAYRLAIVTLDLIGVPKELRMGLEAHLAKRHGLKPEQLLVNASHTHCGPALRVYRPDGGKGEPLVSYDAVPEAEQAVRAAQIVAYNAWLQERITGVIDAALASLAPAELAWHRARCGFAMNRRTPLDGGSNIANSRTRTRTRPSTRRCPCSG